MSKIAIQPYFYATPNMGLEKYKQVVFEGVSHKMSMWAKEDVAGSGGARYITGLNEFAPELDKLPEEEKTAKIIQIRKTVAKLESILASNRVDPALSNKKFWSEVKRILPENNQFWNTIEIAPSNNPIYLDPTEAQDIIIISAIEAGGFPDVAPSLEAAKTAPIRPKFYLDKYEETAKSTTKGSIAETRAKAILIDLYDSNINKLMYICKTLDANSPQYKKSTPNEILFQNMTEYIEGRLGTLKKDAPENFTKISKLDMETLKLRALVKDANFYHFLNPRSGGIYEGSDSQTSLGYNVAEVVEFLKNPLNEAVLTRLLKLVENYWNA